jgi:hypothetical protein
MTILYRVWWTFVSFHYNNFDLVYKKYFIKFGDKINTDGMKNNITTNVLKIALLKHNFSQSSLFSSGQIELLYNNNPNSNSNLFIYFILCFSML